MELKLADYLLLESSNMNVTYLNYPFGKILLCP